MPRYFEFEVSLKEIQPRIWRRFYLRAAATFADLHKAIQESFGWESYHLWEFRVSGPRGQPIAGLPTDEDFGRPVPDARKVKVSSYFTGRVATEWCEYVYDFGDDWVHEVKLIGVVSNKETFRRRLLGGERAGPREDCGGTTGYERMVHFLETGEDVYSDEAVDLKAWLGDWRPDAFELKAAQAAFDR